MFFVRFAGEVYGDLDGCQGVLSNIQKYTSTSARRWLPEGGFGSRLGKLSGAHLCLHLLVGPGPVRVQHLETWRFLSFFTRGGGWISVRKQFA